MNLKFTLLLGILLYLGVASLYAEDTPPAMNGNNTSPEYFTETNTPVALFPGFTITDAENDNINGLTISFTAGHHSDQDNLSFTSQNGITGNFDKNTGVLTLSGSASPANYQTAVRSITYSNDAASDALSYDQRELTISFANGDYLESTGHFYEFINSASYWGTAKTAASGKTYYGLQGYLATVTSAEENSFIKSKISSYTTWLGGSDANTEGTWLWTSGPETGTQFSTGATAYNGSYVNWKSGEPNNSSGIEDYLLMNYSDGTWNDGGNNTLIRYTVEYGGMDGDPTINMTTTTTLDMQSPQPPEIKGNDTSPTYFAETNQALALFPDFTITDTENSDIKGLTIGFSSGHHSDQDNLSFTNQNGISGSFNKSSGILTLTGDASPAEYQAAVRSITYTNDATPGAASYEQRTMIISFANTDFFSPDGSLENGHFYEYVNSGVTYTTARDAASAKTYYGLQGYLATVTSAEENTFIYGLISDIIWIGASDSETEGTWKWVTGPESGTAFSLEGNAIGDSYVNWATGEPNSSTSAEDYLSMYATTYPGKWNDINSDRTYRYVVEYGGMGGETLTMYTTTTLNVLAPQPPEIKGNDTSPNYFAEENEPLALFPEFTITDPENSDIKGLSIGFSSGHHSDQDSLVFVDQNGITGSFDKSTGILILSGDASPATYQAAVRSITYINDAASGSVNDEQRTMIISLANADYFSQSGNLESGHFYEYISTGVYWDVAKSAASAKNYYGLQGYLATATSTEETNFLLGVQDDAHTVSWLGASDAEIPNTWKWVTGPEDGTIFYQNGVVVNGNYENWYTGQPDDSGGAEAYLQFFTNSSAYTAGTWNDRQNSSACGYIVEYGGLADDPDLTYSTTTTLNVLIPPSDLTYSASPVSGVYGTAISSVSPTVTGTVDGYSISPSLPAGLNLDTSTGEISGTPTEVSAQTDYTVTASNAAGDTTTTIQITVEKKDLTITAEDKSKEYDGLAYSGFTAVYDGFVSGEDENNLEGELTFSGSATTAVNVGTDYIITPGGYTSDNYSISYVDGTLDIVQQTQTITFGVLETKVYGDGAFNLTGTSSSGLAVSYTSSNPSVAIISGNTVYIIGAGSTNITASQAGNSNYSAADDVVQELVVSKADQVLTFYLQISESIPLKDFTNPVQVIAVVNSGLPVTVSLGEGSAATLNASNQLENIGQTGNVVVNVTQAGNDNYNPASISKSFDVVKANQSITYPAFSNQTYSSGLEVNIGTATASSGLAVTYSLVSGPATLNGSIVTVTGAGEIVLKASQEGNEEWNPATDVTQSLLISKATPVITNFADIAKEADDVPFTLNATSASTGLFTYSSSDNDVATVLGNTVTIVGAGSAQLTATQDFDENYASASVSVTLTVLPVLPTVTTVAVSSVTSTTASSGGDLTYDGGTESTVKGIVWGTVSSPTVESYNGIADEGTGSGSYVSALTGLSPNTTYFVRAYATNSAGTSYGNEVTFTTSTGELTWTGSANTNWHTAGNWDGNVVPDASYNVTIPAGLTNYPALYEAGECNDLTIESNLTSTGSLRGQFNLTVQGTTTVKRYLTGNAWHLVSSPASGETISDFLSANTNIPSKDVSGTLYRGMMDYDEPTNNWNPFFLNTGQTGDLAAGKGFSLRTNADGVVTFTGALESGTVNTEVARTGDYGWNCVGNPYPSAIFINSNADFEVNFIDLNAANLDDSYGAIYVWDDTNNAYTIIDQDADAFYAQLGQGFFVKVKTDATQVQFIRDMQTTLHPDATFKSGTLQIPELQLTARMGEEGRTTKIKFTDETTTGLDFGRDAGVFKTGFDIYTQLLEDNGVDFGVQSLPETGMEEYVIPVGIDATASGEITISLKSENLKEGIVPVLNDQETGMSFPFNSEEDVYSTSISKSTGYGRFTLTFSSTTDVDDILSGESHFKAWYSNGAIYISGEMDGVGEATVYDMNGRKVAIHQLSYSTQNRIDAPAGANSMYLVRISDSKRSEVLKVPVVGR